MDRISEVRALIGDAPRTAIVPVVEVRADGQGADWSMTIRGHASVFDRLSEDMGFPGFSFREKVQRGAFRKVLDDNQDVRLLINHDANLILARTASKTLELREDPKGLFVYADVGRTSYAEDLRVSMQRGDVDQMSIGFTVARDEWLETTATDGSVEVTRTILEFERLFDASVVTFPAFPQTDAQARSADLEATLERVVNRALSKSGITPPTPETAPSAPVEELGTDAPADTGDTPADSAASGVMGEEDERHLRTAWRRDRLRLLALTPRTVTRAADKAALFVEET